jgi:hypothetical protein
MFISSCELSWPRVRANRPSPEPQTPSPAASSRAKPAITDQQQAHGRTPVPPPAVPTKDSRSSGEPATWCLLSCMLLWACVARWSCRSPACGASPDAGKALAEGCLGSGHVRQPVIGRLPAGGVCHWRASQDRDVLPLHADVERGQERNPCLMHAAEHREDPPPATGQPRRR